jgi:hypothetical protein
MKSNDSLKSMLQKLRYTTTAQRRRETLENIFNAMDESHEQMPATSRCGIRRLTMRTATGKLALAAAVVLIVLGGITFWPFGDASRGQWWLGSPAAWGQELLTTLDTMKAVSCREQTVFVAADGSRHISSTWDKFYVSSDSYRRDIYDGDVLREIQWYVPDGDDMMQHYIRFDLVCYGALKHEGSFGVRDPVDRLRFYVAQMDKAERLLEEKVIEGHNCVGFEIRASAYGDNPDTWVDRIWFDIETKLPVQIEQSGRPVTADPTSTITTVQDQFDYSSQVPADTFVPQEPAAGFVNAHPDGLEQQ